MLGIIIGGCVAGLVAISFAMMVGQAWEKPGTYAGISDASHAPKSSTDCYSFQTGCSNTQSGPSQGQMMNGQYLSGNYGH